MGSVTSFNVLTAWRPQNPYSQGIPLGGPHRRSGNFVEEQNLKHLPSLHQLHGLSSKKAKVYGDCVHQCFSTVGPWHQLYRAARDSPGIDN